MPKPSGTPSKIPKTPAKDLAAKTPNSKILKKKRLQDVASPVSSTSLTLGRTPKKEAIAWRRVCDTIQKCHNENPETFTEHPEWLVVGVSRTDASLKVFIPRPEGKHKELTYCFLSGDE